MTLRADDRADHGAGLALLERSGARAELASALEDLRRGTSAVALVQGEAGIGKTSLVRAFLGEVGDGVRVLVGGCDDLVVPRPLGPVLEAAEALPDLVARLTSGADPARATYAALRSEPTVCVLEDVHWADQASLDVLTYLVRRVAELPLLLVLSFRDDEVPADHPLRRTLAAVPAGRGRRVGLLPLSLDAVRRLAGPGVDPGAVHAVTGGNPFFVSEVLSAGLGETPASVRDAVLGRFARLGPEARATAELVSVVPGRAEDWLVEDCLGDAADVPGCEAQGLLVAEGEGTRYRHELARWAVEEGLSAHRRRELNREVLRRLAARGASDARLAHHAWRAGDVDAVVRHGLVAARSAAAARSHREATELYARVLEHDEQLSPRSRADAWDDYSTEAYAAGQNEAALVARRRALVLRRELGDPRRTSATLRWLSRILWYRGERVACEAAGLEAVELLEGRPPSREHAMALSNLSQLAMLTQRDAEAVSLGRAAERVAIAVSDTETLVHARINIGSALARTDVDAGLAMLESAAREASDEGYDESAARALVNAAWMRMVQHEAGPARELVERGMTLARDRELTLYLRYLHAARAMLALAAGDFDGALRDIASSSQDQAPTYYVRGLVALRRGHPDADALLSDGWERAVATTELQRIGPLACARAEAAWVRGDADEVDRVTAATFALALERGHEWDIGELAVWRARAGLLDVAPPRCATPYALEIAGDHRAAASEWRALGEPCHEALSLLGSHDPDDVARAVGLLDDLGATATLGLARARLRALGVDSVPRGRRPSTRAHPAGLTRRQAEVLDLIGAGLTNAAIADRLVLSPKTVEHHVGAVLAKLGVATRQQAAAVQDRQRAT